MKHFFRRLASFLGWILALTLSTTVTFFIMIALCCVMEDYCTHRDDRVFWNTVLLLGGVVSIMTEISFFLHRAASVWSTDSPDKA